MWSYFAGRTSFSAYDILDGHAKSAHCRLYSSPLLEVFYSIGLTCTTVARPLFPLLARS